MIDYPTYYPTLFTINSKLKYEILKVIEFYPDDQVKIIVDNILTESMDKLLIIQFIENLALFPYIEVVEVIKKLNKCYNKNEILIEFNINK